MPKRERSLFHEPQLRPDEAKNKQILKTNKQTRVGKDAQKSETSPTAGGNGKRHRRRGNGSFIRQLNIDLPYDPAVPSWVCMQDSRVSPLCIAPPHAGVQGREGDVSPLVTTCHHPRAERQESGVCPRPHLTSLSSSESLPLKETTNEGKLLRRPAWASELVQQAKVEASWALQGPKLL